MQKNKNLITVILLAILVVPMTIQLSTTTTTQAAVAPINIPVPLMVYAEPNPVGIGQPVYISMFFTKPLSTGAAFGGTTYTNMSLNIVKPDGTNKTMGPFTSDTTGGVGGISFTPEVTGNYTVQAFYGGQTVTVTDMYTGQVTSIFNILPAISQADTFTVQEEPIPGAVVNPLPTEYWSRPIYATNYPWSATWRQLVGLRQASIH